MIAAQGLAAYLQRSTASGRKSRLRPRPLTEPQGHRRPVSCAHPDHRVMRHRRASVRAAVRRQHASRLAGPATRLQAPAVHSRRSRAHPAVRSSAPCRCNQSAHQGPLSTIPARPTRNLVIVSFSVHGLASAERGDSTFFRPTSPTGHGLAGHDFERRAGRVAEAHRRRADGAHPRRLPRRCRITRRFRPAPLGDRSLGQLAFENDATLTAPSADVAFEHNRVHRAS